MPTKYKCCKEVVSIIIRRENGNVFINDAQLSGGHQQRIEIPKFFKEFSLYLECNGFQITPELRVNGQKVVALGTFETFKFIPSDETGVMAVEVMEMEKTLLKLRETAAKIPKIDIWTITI